MNKLWNLSKRRSGRFLVLNGSGGAILIQQSMDSFYAHSINTLKHWVNNDLFLSSVLALCSALYIFIRILSINHYWAWRFACFSLQYVYVPKLPQIGFEETELWYTSSLFTSEKTRFLLFLISNLKGPFKPLSP